MIDKIKSSDLDPPQHLNNFIVTYGSPIYNNFKAFNIEKLEYTDIDKVMFPKEILDKNISFYYNFKRKNDVGKHDWEQLVGEWRQEHQKQYAYSKTT